MHSLRKAFGRDVYEATGHDLVATQHALGHASVQTTTAYLSADAGRITQAILGMEIREAPKPAPVACAELTQFPKVKEATIA
jgi:integrase